MQESARIELSLAVLMGNPEATSSKGASGPGHSNPTFSERRVTRTKRVPAGDSVTCSGSAVLRDPIGQRCRVPALQRISRNPSMGLGKSWAVRPRAVVSGQTSGAATGKFIPRLESEPRLISGTAQKWPSLSLPDCRSNIPRTRNQAATASWRCLPYTKEISYRAAP